MRRQMLKQNIIKQPISLTNDITNFQIVDITLSLKFGVVEPNSLKFWHYKTILAEYKNNNNNNNKWGQHERLNW